MEEERIVIKIRITDIFITLLGFFLGSILAIARPGGWLNYLVAFLIFAIALALYINYKKEKN